MTTPLHIGFIPLVDAAALLVAADQGFAGFEDLRLLQRSPRDQERFGRAVQQGVALAASEDGNQNASIVFHD